MEQTQRVIAATGADITYDTHAIKEGSDQMSIDDAIASIKHNRVCLQGFLGAAKVPTDPTKPRSLQTEMNRDLGCFAKVSHVAAFDGVPTRLGGIDFFVVREITEGEYCGEENEAVPGVVQSLKVMTKAKGKQVAKFAFEFALKNNRKKVTCE